MNIALNTRLGFVGTENCMLHVQEWKILQGKVN